ncbi:MAG TPA: glycosyltransferase family 2 protein [Candidatus Acetothermia bacterium]|nr:glycosyltransferase family 2 protein [Candidatus Acetothermia bacterium]
MRVSVVIPARNEEAFLPRCLERITEQTLRPYEVIVVDSASTDRTGEIARAFGTKVVRLEKPGITRARQAGFEEAKGDVIASTDADTIVPRDWLERLTAPFSAADVVGTYGDVVYGDELKALAWIFNNGRRFLNVFGLGGLPGQNFAVRRSAFEAVNGFYTPKGNLVYGYPEYEDLWLGLKLIRLGRLVAIPKLCVLSSPRRFKSSKTIFYYFRGVPRVSRMLWWATVGRR